MDGCFPTALGRQSTFSNILGPPLESISVESFMKTYKFSERIRCLRILKNFFNIRDPNITHKCKTSGIRACKHGSEDGFQTALGGRQPNFSDTLVTLPF